MHGDSLLDSVFPAIPALKKKARRPKKKKQEKIIPLIFNITVVDQSVDPLVKDSPLLTFNLPVIGPPVALSTFLRQKKQNKTTTSSKNKTGNSGR